MNGVVTHFVWDGMNMVYEYTDAESSSYIYGTTGILYRKDSAGEVYTYTTSGRGDVVTVADSDGNAREYFYNAYGEIFRAFGAELENPLLYCGEYYDAESGFIYLRNRYYDPSIGRFITEDPVRDGTNWYVYCENNPVMFIDRSGLKPTVEEAALMADHIYTHNQYDNIEDRKVKGGWRLIDVYEDKEGLRIGIYVRGDGEHSTYTGSKEYALVNEGTEFTSVKDWENNWEAYTGYESLDVWESTFFSKYFAKNHVDTEITFVGHSKGGFEASMNAYNTNNNAIVFNPTPAEPGYYEANVGTPFTKEITAYIVKGEILNVQLGNPKIGTRIFLSRQHGWSDKPGLKNQINNHMMSAVLSALDQDGYSKVGP